MEDSQEKGYSFLGNDTFPNLYDALVYEWKFKSEYLERHMPKNWPHKGDISSRHAHCQNNLLPMRS